MRTDDEVADLLELALSDTMDKFRQHAPLRSGNDEHYRRVVEAWMMVYMTAVLVKLDLSADRLRRLIATYERRETL